jgi:lipoprotein NlpD
MLPSGWDAAGNVRPRMSRRAAGAMSLVCCVLLAGCETAPAPVSERRVEEYRKAAPAPSAASKPAPPAEPSAKTSAPAASTAPPPTAAAAKPTAVPQANTGAAASTPATAASKSAAPKAAAGPEAATAAAASTPAASAAKPGAAKTTPTNEEEAEVDGRPEFYTVKRGDTVYSIALDAGLDYKELAAWNQLDDANVIRVGQQLRLHPPAGWKPEAVEAEGAVVRPAAAPPQVESLPLEASPPTKSFPKGIKVPYSEQALTQLTRDPAKAPATDGKPPAEPKPDARATSPVASPTTPAATAPPVQAKAATAPALPAKLSEPVAVPQGHDSAGWMWPTAGKLLHPFNQGNNPKGVAIGGNPGQPIVASAAGKVVYSGMGLRGYGKLIIIKHDNTYLTVYAHNRELLVKEGDRVSKGQRIAEMGNIDSEHVGLHFEIRRLGKPVDPLEYLPQEGAS